MQVYEITDQLKCIADKLHQIHQETVQDDNLALLKHTIQLGWPQMIQDLPPKIHKYWTFHEEQTIEDGIVLKGTYLIIPEAQGNDIL